MLQRIQSTDLRVLHWIHKNMRNRACNILMPLITMTGNFGIIWFLTVGALFIFKPYRTVAYATFWSLFFSAFFGNLIIKNLAKRRRPFDVAEGINTIIAHPRDYSFPSGHTGSSFAAATVIFLFLPYIGLIAFAVAILISFSRLYLCVHFLSDVLTSVFLGILIGVLVHVIFNMHLFG